MDAVQFSKKILDIEHAPNRGMLEKEHGLEPIRIGHRRTGPLVRPVSVAGESSELMT
jgi:hypothetical protein